ncbi:unnamed protein product [Rotaria magnacalcarata]|uniref:Uncharacterized protein n=1 Tax=Rotaria magnacalcarata TaxID=392030 RepID=A0A814YY65_9BILA|nr:unnamed protein product [Rotaria magnacalcarata]
MEYPKDGPVPVEEDIPESISDENIGVHDQDTKEIGAEQHYSDAACLLLALVDTAQPVTPSANNVEHDDMQLALLGDVPPLVDIQNVQPTESVQEHSSMVSAVKTSTPSVYKRLQSPAKKIKNKALKICCDEIEPQTPLQETAEAPIGSVKIVVCGKIIPVSTNTLKLIKVFGSGCSGSVLGVTHKTDPDVKIAVKAATSTIHSTMKSSPIRSQSGIKTQLTSIKTNSTKSSTKSKGKSESKHSRMPMKDRTETCAVQFVPKFNPNSNKNQVPIYHLIRHAFGNMVREAICQLDKEKSGVSSQEIIDHILKYYSFPNNVSESAIRNRTIFTINAGLRAGTLLTVSPNKGVRIGRMRRVYPHMLC